MKNKIDLFIDKRVDNTKKNIYSKYAFAWLNINIGLEYAFEFFLKVFKTVLETVKTMLFQYLFNINSYWSYEFTT